MPQKPLYATAVEDYVKVIYAHTEWQPEPITTSVLAGRLGLAASSVTEMVKKLGVQGLVDHVPYGAVILTPDGTALALRMVRRHRLIETWLAGQFGYGWHEVHDEAEVLEHALSDRLLDSIDEQLGFPTRDPHGDPIPSRDGRVEQPAAVLLRRIGMGETVRVVRISDRDPALLRRLEAESITLDREFTVESVEPFAVRLRDGRSAVALAHDCLDSVWVGR
ncbi:manganese-binding transcriptional regulator MntR [Conyzicola nivalis]|uniref:Manganese transport regulator n=1 Tax=Conyzicola nivalis TaxID=1477021 RepID=A0A916SC75_9MICO|nr:metal-dependent transcriptional regulator [Conyzicola nivalis]GGA90497.1 putative iron dependent transcriptional repressor FeoA [Conyzicola nivalis]